MLTYFVSLYLYSKLFFCSFFSLWIPWTSPWDTSANYRHNFLHRRPVHMASVPTDGPSRLSAAAVLTTAAEAAEPATATVVATAAAAATTVPAASNQVPTVRCGKTGCRNTPTNYLYERSKYNAIDRLAGAWRATAAIFTPGSITTRTKEWNIQGVAVARLML